MLSFHHRGIRAVWFGLPCVLVLLSFSWACRSEVQITDCLTQRELDASEDGESGPRCLEGPYGTSVKQLVLFGATLWAVTDENRALSLPVLTGVRERELEWTESKIQSVDRLIPIRGELWGIWTENGFKRFDPADTLDWRADPLGLGSSDLTCLVDVSTPGGVISLKGTHKGLDVGPKSYGWGEVHKITEVDGQILVLAEKGLYKSDDRGGEWTSVSLQNHEASDSLRGMAVDGDIVFVAAASGVWSGTPGGADDPEEGVFKRLPPIPADAEITAIELVEFGPQRWLVAGTDQGVFVWEKPTRSWTPQNEVGNAYVNDLESDRFGSLYVATTTTVFRGLKPEVPESFRFDWKEISTEIGTEVWTVATAGDMEFAGTATGVFARSGPKEPWTRHGSNLKAAVKALAVIEVREETRLYAATNHGLAYSRAVPGANKWTWLFEDQAIWRMHYSVADGLLGVGGEKGLLLFDPLQEKVVPGSERSLGPSGPIRGIMALGEASGGVTWYAATNTRLLKYTQADSDEWREMAAVSELGDEEFVTWLGGRGPSELLIGTSTGRILLAGFSPSFQVRPIGVGSKGHVVDVWQAEDGPVLIATSEGLYASTSGWENFEPIKGLQNGSYSFKQANSMVAKEGKSLLLATDSGVHLASIVTTVNWYIVVPATVGLVLVFFVLYSLKSKPAEPEPDEPRRAVDPGVSSFHIPAPEEAGDYHHHVYLSFADCDKERALDLCRELEELGVQSWNRTLLLGGYNDGSDDLQPKFDESILFVALYSSRSEAQPNIAAHYLERRLCLEYSKAFPPRRRFITPARLDSKVETPDNLRRIGPRRGKTVSVDLSGDNWAKGVQDIANRALEEFEVCQSLTRDSAGTGRDGSEERTGSTPANPQSRRPERDKHG